MKEIIKKALHILLILVIIGILGIFIYLFIVDVNATKAKNYLIKEYGLGNTDFIAYKYIEYVYDEDQECGTLWFKSCTKDEDISKKVYFIDKNKKKFVVYEYNDGTFEDDYGPSKKREKEDINQQNVDKQNSSENNQTDNDKKAE